MGPGAGRSNFAKHEVTFDAAGEVFSDAFAAAELDDRRDYGESRLILIGQAGEPILSVVFTMRGENRRFISARAADRREVKL